MGSSMAESETVLVFLLLWDIQLHMFSGKLGLWVWCSEEESKLPVKFGDLSA